MPSGADITVLHYTGYALPGGGIETVVRALAQEGRFRCVLGVAPAYPEAAAGALPLWRGPQVLGESITPWNALRAARVALAVRGWLRGSPGRVFHGHSRAGLLVGCWLRLFGAGPAVVSVHCYGSQRWFYRGVLRLLGDRLFWLSPAMRNYYGARGRDWDQCIPGGVTLAPDFRRDAAAADRLHLGGIGALTRWKRWDRILSAIAALPEAARHRVRFSHIGGGDEAYRSELIRLADRLGLGEQVAFRGIEPGPAKLLGEIDALVVAAEREPFSMAMLEALAAGVPVIAADDGGAVDVVRDGVNGWLYAAADPLALNARLAAWLAEPPRFDRQAIRRSTVLAETVARRWSDVYARL